MVVQNLQFEMTWYYWENLKQCLVLKKNIYKSLKLEFQEKFEEYMEKEILIIDLITFNIFIITTYI